MKMPYKQSVQSVFNKLAGAGGDNDSPRQFKPGMLLDLFFCAVFMPVLVLLGPAHHWLGQWPLFFFIACTYLYLCYFIVMRMKIPTLLLDKRYYKILLTISSLIIINYLISLYPLPDMDFVTPAMSQYQTRVRNFGVSVTLWLMFSLVMGYALSISFVKELYEQLLMRKRLEAQRDKAQLAVFKAQISPHFLFNTLNSLYSLVIGTSQKAEDAFIKFTDLLKYTYVTIEKETVPLKDEIDYIKNYVDLQRLRLNEHTHIELDFDVRNEDIMIPPMLMLTFVENAFKYGASTSQDCNILISLHTYDNLLCFETKNTIMKRAEEFRKDVPVGIANCKARLSSLFPGRYSLLTYERDGVFTVDLDINL